MKKLIFVTALLITCSCSTIFNSGSQTILANPANPEHEGVTVTVTTSSGAYRTKLPATIVASPSTFSNLMIKVSDKCYEGTEVKVKKGITPSYWVNIIIWPGLIVDALDGYMWKFDSQTMVPTTKLDRCTK